MTTLTMRLIKGHFIVSGPDVEPMKFKSRPEARDWCKTHHPGSPITEIGPGGTARSTQEAGATGSRRLKHSVKRFTPRGLSTDLSCFSGKSLAEPQEALAMPDTTPPAGGCLRVTDAAMCVVLEQAGEGAEKAPEPRSWFLCQISDTTAGDRCRTQLHCWRSAPAWR